MGQPICLYTFLEIKKFFYISSNNSREKKNSKAMTSFEKHVINETIVKLNECLSMRFDLSNKISILTYIKQLFSYTRSDVQKAFTDAVSFKYSSIYNMATDLGEDISILLWVLQSRFYLIENVEKWINADKNESIKDYTSIYNVLKSQEINEDEILYIPLSQLYDNLILLINTSSKVNIIELNDCLREYYNRVCIFLAMCYDKTVFDNPTFLEECSTNSDVFRTNKVFATHMFYIFEYFKRLNCIILVETRDCDDVSNGILTWLIDNMSKCETFDDVSTYYSKFLLQSKLCSVDYVIHSHGEEKLDEYSLYCKKYKRLFEVDSSKRLVSNILKNGPTHADFSIACLFSLNHLFSQYIDGYKNDICVPLTEKTKQDYIIQRCCIRELYIINKKGKYVGYESFIDCFSEWYVTFKDTSSNMPKSKMSGSYQKVFELIATILG